MTEPEDFGLTLCQECHGEESGHYCSCLGAGWLVDGKADPKLVKVRFLEKNGRKCHYCDNAATKTLIWLKDKKQHPARIKLPWCGCDLMQALKKIWQTPYQVIQDRDYDWETLNGLPKDWEYLSIKDQLHTAYVRLDQLALAQKDNDNYEAADEVRVVRNMLLKIADRLG